MVTPTSFEWDGAKAKSNLAKHLVSFEVAIALFLDDHRREEPDLRFTYGEDRLNAIGLADGVCLAVTFTMRGDVARIVSARPASREERNRYGYRP